MRFQSVYITEDLVYVLFSGDIVVLDHDFTELSIMEVQEETFFRGMESFHVTDEAIYHTIGFEGDLYRYDLEEEMSEFLTDDIFNMVVVENQLFHFNGTAGYSNIYALDKITGEVAVLFEGQAREFFVNKEAGMILFITLDALYQVDFDGNNLERLLDIDRPETFAFDGEMISWISRTGVEVSEMYTFNLVTGEQEMFELDAAFDSFSMTANYFFATTSGSDSTLYLIDRENPANRRQLGIDVFGFVVVGDYIIYDIIGSFNMYIMDFEGNDRVLLRSR